VVLLAKATMTANDPERYSIQIDGGRSLKIVPDKNAEQLNNKQLIDYQEHRTFVGWNQRLIRPNGTTIKNSSLVGVIPRGTS